MLLTLSTRSFANTLQSAHARDRAAGSGTRPAKRTKGASTAAATTGPLSILDLPDYAMRKLKLRGLSVLASMLAGWSLEDLDRLRDRADKAGCPCLVLVDDMPLALSHSKAAPGEAAPSRGADDLPASPFAGRIHRLATAAHRLGCSALSVRVEAEDTDDEFERLVGELRDLMPVVEHFELYLLLAPSDGLTRSCDRLVEVIKRIGGFRVGCMASFAHAADAAGKRDPVSVLRVLAPYAGAIHATVRGFDQKGQHIGYDLAEFVTAVRSVGFSNTLAVEYVGDGDPGPSLERACDILREALAEEPAAAGPATGGNDDGAADGGSDDGSVGGPVGGPVGGADS